ncbi:tetratricopeptide repeat protein [Massilia sp. DD77]|uniref:tetratricopeptide repeat protein n=1 Tax=Massilia sp. DD77 TaxID=3109349 RepID=UPI002FFF2F1D
MTLSTHFSRAAAAASLALLLTACGTAPKAVPAAPTLDELLTQASQAAAGGNKEQAVTLWKQGATAFPAEKAPWSYIAQTRYESGQYGDAIQAALEVLVRDPNDKLANSIIAISGLRLSTRALGDLSRQNNLSGSLKTESQELAKLLRENLGESVLVPPPVQPPVRSSERPAKAVKKTAKAAASKKASADPFQALN